MFEIFDANARDALARAQAIAQEHGQSELGTEHLLQAVLAFEGGVSAAALESFGLSLGVLRGLAHPRLETLPEPSVVHTPLSARSRKVLELALRESIRLGHGYIGTEHLLLGLVRERRGIAAATLRGFGLNLTLLRRAVAQITEERRR